MLGREIRTARLVLTPVNWPDLEAMATLKADAGAFGRMLGGIRSRLETESEMAADVALWARRGVGIFTIREQGRFVGITGVHERPDGRGLGLRFSIFPWAAGRGIAREAASAALRFVLDSGEKRVIAVAREDNLASRMVLGSIGMRHVETFLRDGDTMMLYESLADS
ncbi:GNAT family N-acetyltransferase [Gluconobacter morbifer]|uniref:Putative acetyltransferase n=1 Tax=Gluconobacter morbifer G707 TaxID=1088869 RepID=G6XJQ3_9PROT|nr:GNAT family N-acetyltransferase [Gluconobacter morbifer]EHH67865.1 putative acetyltransferase [Gluconobacter morbifer G707]